MAPKISVIVPVYNVERYLRRCVASIREQTLKDLEIILVDDGSPDGCPVMCDAFAAEDPRIQVIHKKNAGLGYARNSGMELATGEYIGFVDSDDFIRPEMYELLYKAATEIGADVAYAGIAFVQNGKETGKYRFTEKKQVWEGKSQLKNLLMDMLCAEPGCPKDSKYGASVGSGIFRRALLEDNGIRFFSEREYVSEDGLFDIDVLTRADKAVMIPEICYSYDYNPDSLTKVYRGHRFDQNKALFSFGKEKLWKAYQDEAVLNQYGRMFIAAARVCIIQEAIHAKDVGARAAVEGIRRICSDEVLRQTLESYPWQMFPFKKRVFAFLTRYRLAWAQYLLVTLANQ
ncbi:MAG: glycosyltransferase [Oscillospiraceae bacterium]|nr:glycosyltransferase [Oscillospiraceae bacterium]